MRDDELPIMQCERCGAETDGEDALCQRHLAMIEEADREETEEEAGRRNDEARNDRGGREINAAAKVRAAGLDPATCGEEQAAAVDGVGPLMAAAVCRAARRFAAERHTPGWHLDDPDAIDAALVNAHGGTILPET